MASFVAANMPAAHGWQVEPFAPPQAATTRRVPVGHGARHNWQLLWPSWIANWASGHAWQLLWPLSDWNRPLGHAVQEAAARALNVPDSQLWQPLRVTVM